MIQYRVKGTVPSEEGDKPTKVDLTLEMDTMGMVSGSDIIHYIVRDLDLELSIAHYEYNAVFLPYNGAVILRESEQSIISSGRCDKNVLSLECNPIVEEEEDVE